MEGCPEREAASLPGSGSPGLKRSQAQQGRHLSEAQRALCAARFATLRQGQTPRIYEKDKATAEALTRAEAAELFRVSVCSIDRAKAILRYGPPDLVARIEAGKASLADADGLRPRQRRTGEPKGAAEKKARDAGHAARELVERLGAERANWVLDIVQAVGLGRVRAAVNALGTAAPELSPFAPPAVALEVAARVAKSAATRAERKRRAALSPARPYPTTPLPMAAGEPAVAA